MADGYSVGAPGIAFADAQCMLGVYNAVGSGKILKVYRAFAMNAQTQTVSTPTQLQLSLLRFSTGSGGLAMNIIKHDTQAPTLPAQVVASTLMSYTADINGSVFKKVMWSTKEPLAANAGFVNELQVNPNFTYLWNAEKSYYNDIKVETIVLREGYGCGIVCNVPSGQVIGSAAVADYFIEFTAE